MGENRIEERDVTLILDQIEFIDDDDLASIEEARQLEEREVDYSNGLSVSKSFEDSSADFQDISDEADQINDLMLEKKEQLLKMLEKGF